MGTLIEFDPIQKFLNTRGEGTRKLYAYALREFKNYYAPKGNISQFIDRVQEDLKQTDWKEKDQVAQNVLKDFSATLQAKGLAPKSVRTYVAAVQSMLKNYLGVEVALFAKTMPPAITQSRPYEWTLESVNNFVNSMTAPMYQSLAATLFQSGLGIHEALVLEYQDIKAEYENNICPLCLDFGTKTRKKTEFPFLTFIGSWALKYLKAYLKDKQLTLETRLYPTDKERADAYFRATAKLFLGSWKGRNPMRPHSLRAAFKTTCTDAKVIDRMYVEFFMAHGKKGQDVEETYVSKNHESWRETYRKIEPFLTPK